MQDNKRFNDVLYAVSDSCRQVLGLLSPTVKQNANEIRMRLGLPLALTVGTETVFVRENGQTQFFLSNDLYKITQNDLEESFKKLCNNSVFAHENELKNGYIVMKNGSRAGVCGNLTASGALKDISSINLRIAREVFGCANEIVKDYKNGTHLCEKFHKILREEIATSYELKFDAPTPISIDGEIKFIDHAKISTAKGALKFLIPSGVNDIPALVKENETVNA
jgi:hypothetical protein